MVTADSYSDFVEVDFLNNTKTTTIISACKRNFARHGSPEVVVTDNGPQFDNEEWLKFGRQWDFAPVTSSPYHAQGNGKSESAVKALKQLYRKCAKSGTDFWRALQQHRNTPNAVGLSPNQRLCSRDTRSTIPVVTNRLRPPQASHVDESIRHKRTVTKMSYDKKAKKLPELQIGANVLVQRRPDLQSTWEQAILRRRHEDQSCEVQTNEGAVYRRSAVHVKPVPTTSQAAQVENQHNVQPKQQGNLNHQQSMRQCGDNEHRDSTNVPEKRIFERRDYNKGNPHGAGAWSPPQAEQQSSRALGMDGRLNAAIEESDIPLSSIAARPRREVVKPKRFSDYLM
ncbi:uncharacterized protein K02A2.6-like [Armigeres subalbatus]|uniref:uncharacterized protein K02A2.6-like n=1 Tax=Armigeres subalbatus TaxID=124917 RepID=UPI002ED40C07